MFVYVPPKHGEYGRLSRSNKTENIIDIKFIGVLYLKVVETLNMPVFYTDILIRYIL